MEEDENTLIIDDSDLVDETLPLSVNKEHLQLISYNRSKKWANKIKNFADAKDCDFLDIYSLGEDGDGSNDEEDDSNSSSENMAEEADVLEERDFFSCQDSIVAIVQNLTVSNAQGILTQINRRSNDTGIVNTEIQTFLEETLPLIEEYRRDFREAGLERVLKTFDIDKIEKKVGSWMRRNNSIVNRSLALSPRDRYKPYKQREESSETDSSGSLQSFDTGRYIRMSKKQLSIKKRIATTTTTIKSYRLFESKRDELRKKYAYLVPDDTMDIMNGTHRRPQNAGYRGRPERTNEIHRIDKKRLALESYSIRKRRHRRRFHSPCTSLSSSSDEMLPKKELDLPKRRQERKLNHARKDRLKMYVGNDDEINGHLPYKKEMECRCRTADKLCKNARHLANSSAEDWLVENLENPPQTVCKKIDKLLSEKKQKRLIIDNSNCTDKIKLPTIEDDVTLNSKKESKTKSLMAKKSKRDAAKRTYIKTNAKKNAISNRKVTPNPSEVTEESDDDSFQIQLQEALKLSKQQYEDELKAKSEKNRLKTNSHLEMNSTIKSSYDKTNHHFSTPHKSNEESKKYESTQDSIGKKEVIETLNTHKTDHKKKVGKKKVATNLDLLAAEGICSKQIYSNRAENDISCYPNETQSVNTAAEYSTCFGNSSNIYNSTALDNNTTIVHRINERKSTPKMRNLETKTTKISKPIKNTVLSVSGKTLDNHAEKNKLLRKGSVQENCMVSTENDCIVSSSSTENDIPIKTIISNTTKKHNGLMVLYTPKDQSMTSDKSITNGRVRITQENLAKLIGNTSASKFIKYYVGSLEFKESSTVYYEPPKNDINVSDSDIDELDKCLKYRYGRLIESKNPINSN